MPSSPEQAATASQPVAEPATDAAAPPASPPAEPEVAETAGAATGPPDAEFRGEEREDGPERPLPPRREAPPPRRRDFRPAAPAAVEQAIEQVNHIVETLRATLDDMEEVLETVELAERQKNADEEEIENLRRSLRHLQRPREGGSSHSRR